MTRLPGNLRGVPNHDNHRVDQLADCYDVRHLLQNTGAGELDYGTMYLEAIFTFQSDIEWKFGLAKLIRNMQRKVFLF